MTDQQAKVSGFDEKLGERLAAESFRPLHIEDDPIARDIWRDIVHSILASLSATHAIVPQAECVTDREMLERAIDKLIENNICPPDHPEKYTCDGACEDHWIAWLARSAKEACPYV